MGFVSGSTPRGLGLCQRAAPGLQRAAPEIVPLAPSAADGKRPRWWLPSRRTPPPLPMTCPSEKALCSAVQRGKAPSLAARVVASRADDGQQLSRSPSSVNARTVARPAPIAGLFQPTLGIRWLALVDLRVRRSSQNKRSRGSFLWIFQRSSEVTPNCRCSVRHFHGGSFVFEPGGSRTSLKNAHWTSSI